LVRSPLRSSLRAPHRTWRAGAATADGRKITPLAGYALKVIVTVRGTAPEIKRTHPTQYAPEAEASGALPMHA